MKKQALNLFVGATLYSLFNSILLTACFAPCSSSAQVPSYVPTNGLVGWWPFNGNANDESGYGNNGTVNSALLTTDRFGVADKAFSFDGIQSKIIINDNAQLDQLSLTDFTISFWYNAGQNDGGWFDGMISRGWMNGDNFFGFQIGRANNVILFQTNAPFCSNQVHNASTGEWRQIIQIYALASGLVYNYIDGTLISTISTCESIVSQIENSSDLFFGVERGAELHYNGKLDDIGIWNRALSETEITALHNSCTTTISSQPLNQTINLTSTNSAQFIIASSVTGLTYQWQTNQGLGFQNLSDAGQYSGTTTNTLNVSNVTFANNNQQFRCLVTDGSCADTTDIAVLSVVDDLGISHLQNNASKKLIKITDLNGKETHFRKNTVLVFIYEDGTIERVFVAE